MWSKISSMWGKIAPHENFCSTDNVRYKYDVYPKLRFRCMEQMALFFLFGLWRSLFICANISCTDPLTHRNWIWYILHIWHLVWNPIVISPDQTRPDCKNVSVSNCKNVFVSNFKNVFVPICKNEFVSNCKNVLVSNCKKVFVTNCKNVFVANWKQCICLGGTYLLTI